MEQFVNMRTLLESNRISALRQIMMDMEPYDIYAFIKELDAEKRLLVFRILPKDMAAQVFAHMDTQEQEHIVSAISDSEMRRVVDELFLDDTVDFLEEVPASVVKRVLRLADPKTREHITQFLRYPRDSAAALMTVEIADLHDSLTVGQALERIRQIGEELESVSTLYTIDDTRHLTGSIGLLQLICAQPEVCLADIARRNVHSVPTLMDQEEVAQQFSDYDLSQMPVVDKEGRLVGLITVDDIVDVMRQEATEDFEKMAAVSPLDKPYLKAGVWEMSKKRVAWLLILMISATVTGMIITRFEVALQSVVILAAFIPMLMDTGGNSGSQSSVLVIRGLALGEISLRDGLRVFWKELRIGLVVGVILGLVNGVRIMLFERVNWQIAVSVSISLLITVVVSKVVGGVLPLLAKRCKLDPAIMAAPLITTIVDAVSLTVYFGICTFMLGI